MKAIVKTNEEVLPYVCIFHLLQKHERALLNPEDVTELLNPVKQAEKLILSKVFVWNQLSDPNLGIHDFLKLKDSESAEFKWVVVDGELEEIKDLLPNEKDSSEIELVEIMNQLHMQKKFPSYFVAEGVYEGMEGLHFCLTPYNDLTSCEALNGLFSPEFIKEAQDNPENIDGVDIDIQFNSDGIDPAHELFLNHFKKTLNLSAS